MQNDSLNEEHEVKKNNPHLNYENVVVFFHKPIKLELIGATGKIEWKSTDSKVVKVSKDGTVKAVLRGTCIVIAKCNNISYECEVTAMAPHINRAKLSMFIGATNELSLVGTEAKKWSSTDISVATVTNNGHVVAKKEGECVIECSATNGKKYTCYLRVKSRRNENKIVTLSMIGDIVTHNELNLSCTQKDGTLDHSCLFKKVKPEIKSTDISIVNQEIIIGGEELGNYALSKQETEDGYPAFNLPYKMGDVLVDTGFNVILHATNHVLDVGEQGIINCVNYWKNQHPEVKALGIFTNKKDHDEIYVYEKYGMKIAILNFTYGTNHKKSKYSYSINYMTKKNVKDQIERANKLADFVIVCPHWGKQYELKESIVQRGWAMRFLEYGADLVLGTHPHVIEPIKIISDDGKRDMIVYYSIGNFFCWTNLKWKKAAHQEIGGMAKVSIGYDDSGNVVVKKHGIKALVAHLSTKRNGSTVYYVKKYSNSLANKNCIKTINKADVSPEYCTELCNEIWGDLWE